MTIAIRSPASEEELRAAMSVGEAGFGSKPHDSDFERHSQTMPRDRFLAAYDDGRPVGTTASFAFELTLPGGVVPAAGVTWVSVLPTHRRRGILRQFMNRQLADARERGEPIAILLASEAAIYGRFGYGIAAPSVHLDADCTRFALRDDAGPAGSVRIVDADEALLLFPPVHERVRTSVPGMLARRPEWWREYKLADPEHWRAGAGPKFRVVHERDGAAAGYAVYRIKQEWKHGFAQSEVQAHDVCGIDAAATLELWRFLFNIDLTIRVRMTWFDPGSPLLLAVEDMRSLGLRFGDGLWLRFVDVEQALRARSYAGDDAVVLDVRDNVCPWNAGRYRVGATVERTQDAADLDLDVADLASVYLGAFDFHALERSQRVRALRPGAVERASAVFRTTRPPHCAEEF